MNDTALFTDPTASLYDLGVSVRDLAYKKLEEECIIKYAMAFETGSLDHISIDRENGGISINTPTGDVQFDFDADNPVSPWALDTSPISASGIFDHIPEMFDRFTPRGVEQCERAIEVLEILSGTGRTSEGIAQRIDVPAQSLESATEDWLGWAAIKFHESFVLPMLPAKFHHEDIAKELLAGVIAQRDLMKQAEANAIEIANEARSALFNYPAQVSVWNVLMPIVGAALAGISFVATSPAGGATITMGLLSLANTAANSGKTVVGEMSGDGNPSSTLDIIDTMDAAIKKLDNEIQIQTNDVKAALTETVTDLEGILAAAPEVRQYLVPRRPTFVDGGPSLTDFKAPNL